MVREVKAVKGDGTVAKLFAKHMKAKEQADFLKKTKVSIAVGTPARVGKLLADGALQVDKSTIVLLDLGHKDTSESSRLHVWCDFDTIDGATPLRLGRVWCA